MLNNSTTPLRGRSSIASGGRPFVQLPISERTVFLDVNGVRAARGISANKVCELVESGKLLWVFDVGQMRGKKKRALRFWAQEIVDAGAVAKLKLDDVISKILPVSRRSFNGAEIGQWFLVSRPTVQRIGSETRSGVKSRLLHVRRDSLAEFLRKNWLGAGSQRGKASAT